MISRELIAQFQGWLDQAKAAFAGISELAGQFQNLVVTHFGQNGLLAAYIVLGIIGLAVVIQLAKLCLNIVRYLVIPAVALALVVSFFLPYSFYALLPPSAIVCSLFLLFKS